MPSKRQSEIEDPPSASSTDDGSEEESGEEESGTEEEEESSPPHKNAAPLQTSAQKPPTNHKSNKQVPQTQPSSDEDGDDEDDASSDEEAPNKQPVPNLKPTEAPKSKKSSMNATTDTNFAAPSGTKTTASKFSASKRPLEPEKTEKESKSQKKKKVAEVTEEDGHTEEPDKKIVVAALTGGDQKKNAFARVWTEEDEIALIRAMLSVTKKGKNVSSSNVDELYDITKGSFTFDANRGQLANKIRSVKSKYQSHWHKAKDGEEPHFKNPHDEKTFQLCKKLWGKVEVTEGNGNDAKGKGKGSNKSSNGVASPKKKSSNSSEVLKVEVKEDFIDEEDWDEFGYTNLAFTIGKDLTAMPAGLANLFTKKNLRHIEISKRKELESRWRQLFDKENELLFERMDLVREMTHLMKK